MHTPMRTTFRTLVCTTAILLLATGCESETDSSELQNDNTGNPEARIGYATFTPSSRGGIAAVFSDDENKESIGIEVVGNTQGEASRVNRIYLTDRLKGALATLTLGEDGIPSELEFPDGIKMEFANTTATSTELTVLDSSGLIISGPTLVQGDFNDTLNYATVFSGTTKQPKFSTRGWDLNSTCEWMGGCGTLYWIASKTLDSYGCYLSGAAAATSGGLLIPLAVGVCGSTLVSIASDLAVAKTEEGLYEATGQLSSNLATAGNCISAVIGATAEKIDCIKGIGEEIYWIYDKAHQNRTSINLFPDNCLTGQWAGEQYCQTSNGLGQTGNGAPFEGRFSIVQSDDNLQFPGESDQITGVNAVSLPANSTLAPGSYTVKRSAVVDTSLEQSSFSTSVDQTITFKNCATSHVSSEINIKYQGTETGIPNTKIVCAGNALKNQN